MPYRKEQFVNDEYYHVLNRGIDGRNIFMEENDYLRFLECLKDFNTLERIKIREIRNSSNQVSGDENIVRVICYCLMPNHFHLLLKQCVDNGIQVFLQKLGLGYTRFFNLKNERQGHLFQGPFKAVPILKDAQLLHISRYIHLNALDLFDAKWREGKLADWPKAKNYLENYPWSSYPVFVGKQKSDFCQPEIMSEIFKSSSEYENFLKEWSERGGTDLVELALE